MFTIDAKSLSKKFNRHFLFRDFSFQFLQGNSYALTGHNGSGKSTLLQIIAGIQLPTSGTLEWKKNSTELLDSVYSYLSFSAPYTEVLEEFTLDELLEFHAQLKPFSKSIKLADVLKDCGLQAHRNKEIRWYSSGMKQRVKLVLSVFSDTPLLFLDEPTSNLDEAGIDWYRTVIQENKKQKLLIIASNQRNEYDFCDQVIQLKDFSIIK